ncbi:PTS sugar transporter subunit IIA [Enterococcus faecium]|nr:PTS sugar transporter subunit IIA [Enterococcus faecium]
MINLKKLLPEDHIETTNQILTWQEAVQLASQPQLNEKAIDQQYVTNMIHSVEENGPYMVLADYFALMHARPGEGVFHQGMSLLVTKNEIDLAGKPVRIFLVLAAKDSQSHLESLQEIMEVFMDQEKYQLILNGDKEQICQLFQ